jgi:type VI secretion system protein ImpA
MSSIDLSSLTSAVSEAAPAGPNLEDDPLFSDLEVSAKGKPEQQFGETVIPAEEPDWRQAKSKALDLLGKTRDLRAGVTLTRALIRTDGAEGLADGLSLLQGWLDGMWDAVHPQLDPADPDPIQRVNSLGALDDFEASLRAVRDIPLVASRAIGRFAYKDVLVASGKLPAPAGQGDPPSFAAIEAAFQDASVEDVQKTASDLDRALGAIAGIEGAFTSRVGAARGVALGQLTSLLKGARQTVAEQLEKKTASSGIAVEEVAGVPGAAPAPRAVPGEVRTRDDVMKALDKICEYFDRHEPSSPVPILLRRAKKLVNKSFMELVRDMASNGVSQVEVFRGPEE